MRRSLSLGAGAIILGAMALPGGAARAQDGATGAPPERIDLTITAAPPNRLSDEECRRRREAAVVSGEIIVCGSRPGDFDPSYSSREDAQNRYAAQTAFRDSPATPNVDGPGIFHGPATFSGLCIKGVLNCPKPPALIVDVASLPQAPPGSDADRIARGLPPLGEDEARAAARVVAARQRAEFDLPPPPAQPPAADATAAAAPVSRAESAEPEAPR